MSEEILKVLRHIFDARIDNADDYSAYIAWTSARDIVEYALANNLECLKEFDYLPTKEDEEVSINIIKGLKEVCEQFDATLGCSEEFLESHHLA